MMISSCAYETPLTNLGYLDGVVEIDSSPILLYFCILSGCPYEILLTNLWYLDGVVEIDSSSTSILSYVSIFVLE